VQRVWLLIKSAQNLYAVSKIPKKCQIVTLPYKCHGHLNHLADAFTSLCNLRNNEKLRYRHIYIAVSNQIYTMIYVPVFCSFIWIPSDCSFCVIAGIFPISASVSCELPILQHSCSNTHAHARPCNRKCQENLQKFSDLRQDQNSVMKRTHLNTFLFFWCFADRAFQYIYLSN